MTGIRLASADDAGAIARVQIAAWRAAYVDIVPAQFLASLDVGLSPEGRAEVYTVYVDPVTWRRGIGSRLMATIDDFWRPAGIRELVLWTFEDNPAARGFYEQLGYTFDGTRKIDDFGGTRIAEVRFRRLLSSL